jgi:hypothetical protein
MHPCASWLTLALLTGSLAPAAGAARGPQRLQPRRPRRARPPRLRPRRPTEADPDDAAAERAATLYSQRKYLDAAQILEELWTRVHEPRDLFNAALARIALGHRAHAIHYWETYVKQANIPNDGREQAPRRAARRPRPRASASTCASPRPRSPRSASPTRSSA